MAKEKTRDQRIAAERRRLSAIFAEIEVKHKQAPYMRERPEAKVYATMNSNYQKIIKQLTDLLPKEEAEKKGGDDFENF